MKRLSHILYILTFALSVLAIAPVAQAADAFTVVIDAGHGGKDAGCVGEYTREKDVTLDVAQRLGKLIQDFYEDEVKVVLTRDDDTFVPLDQRARIANNSKGDLFISIHVNSIDKRSKGRQYVHGASVYTVGLHKSEANLSVAMRENAVIELEQDFSETYQGFDPQSSESYIIFELGQHMNMEQSVDFASMAQRQLVDTAGRADKGVRQAGFLVLWATKMPSVLVELDFMCNPAAEEYLASKNGREQCAIALFNAFKCYKGKNPSKLT